MNTLIILIVYCLGIWKLFELCDKLANKYLPIDSVVYSDGRDEKKIKRIIVGSIILFVIGITFVTLPSKSEEVKIEVKNTKVEDITKQSSIRPENIVDQEIERGSIWIYDPPNDNPFKKINHHKVKVKDVRNGYVSYKYIEKDWNDDSESVYWFLKFWKKVY